MGQNTLQRGTFKKLLSLELQTSIILSSDQLCNRTMLSNSVESSAISLVFSLWFLPWEWGETAIHYRGNYQDTKGEAHNIIKTTLLSLFYIEKKWKCYYSQCCHTGSHLSRVRLDRIYLDFFLLTRSQEKKRVHRTQKGGNLFLTICRVHYQDIFAYFV